MTIGHSYMFAILLCEREDPEPPFSTHHMHVQLSVPYCCADKCGGRDVTEFAGFGCRGDIF